MEITKLSKRIKWLQQVIHRGGRKIPVLKGGGNAERPSAPTHDTIAVSSGRLEVGKTTEVDIGFATDSVGDVIPPDANDPEGRSLLLSTLITTRRRDELFQLRCQPEGNLDSAPNEDSSPKPAPVQT